MQSTCSRFIEVLLPNRHVLDVSSLAPFFSTCFYLLSCWSFPMLDQSDWCLWRNCQNTDFSTLFFVIVIQWPCLGRIFCSSFFLQHSYVVYTKSLGSRSRARQSKSGPNNDDMNGPASQTVRPVKHSTPSLKKSCDFCVKRKRHCDGFGRKRCR